MLYCFYIINIHLAKSHRKQNKNIADVDVDSFLLINGLGEIINLKSGVEKKCSSI